MTFECWFKSTVQPINVEMYVRKYIKCMPERISLLIELHLLWKRTQEMQIQIPNSDSFQLKSSLFGEINIEMVVLNLSPKLEFVASLQQKMHKRITDSARSDGIAA